MTKDETDAMVKLNAKLNAEFEEAAIQQQKFIAEMQMTKETDAMVEAHREAAWRHGFLCGFSWAALAVITAAGISAIWIATHTSPVKDVLKIERKK